MKKSGLYIILMLLSLAASASLPDVPYYRRMMELSYKSSESAQAFYKHTRKIEETEHPTLLGYKAMSELMMCQHVSGPLNKLGFFKRGKKLLELAIEKDRNNAELRFMRFCTQNNIPAILNYNEELDEDKNFLIGYLKRATIKDSILNKLIRDYLLDNKLCSSSEKQTIRNL